MWYRRYELESIYIVSIILILLSDHQSIALEDSSVRSFTIAAHSLIHAYQHSSPEDERAVSVLSKTCQRSCDRTYCW